MSQETVYVPLHPTVTAAYTGTAAATSAAPTGVTRARLHASTACYVRVDGTATSSSMPLRADAEEYIGVPAGATVSAIQQSSGGTLSVTWLKPQ